MNGDRPISTVLNDIVGDIQNIVRSEFRLAKTEVTEEMGKAGSSAVMLGAGLVMLLFSALFALLAIVYALSLVMPQWAAALIVAAGEGLMAAIFVAVGIKKFKAMRAPPKTVACWRSS